MAAEQADRPAPRDAGSPDTFDAIRRVFATATAP